jgi:hypothetical protein
MFATLLDVSGILYLSEFQDFTSATKRKGFKYDHYKIIAFLVGSAGRRVIACTIVYIQPYPYTMDGVNLTEITA